MRPRAWREAERRTQPAEDRPRGPGVAAAQPAGKGGHLRPGPRAPNPHWGRWSGVTKAAGTGWLALRDGLGFLCQESPGLHPVLPQAGIQGNQGPRPAPGWHPGKCQAMFCGGNRPTCVPNPEGQICSQDCGVPLPGDPKHEALVGASWVRQGRGQEGPSRATTSTTQLLGKFLDLSVSDHTSCWPDCTELGVVGSFLIEPVSCSRVAG